MTMTANLINQKNLGSALLQGAGGMQANLILQALTQTLLVNQMQGSGTLVGNVHLIRHMTAAFAGAGSLTARLAIPQSIRASLAGAGGLGVDIVIAGAADTTTGLIVWYKFDNTTTTDSSGNGNTGTPEGTHPTLVTGHIGSALSFTGTGTASGSWIDFSSVTGLGLATATSEITFACWVNTSALDTPLISYRDASGTPVLDFVIGANGVDNAGTGRLSVIVRDDGGGGLTGIHSTASINDSTWHHVAFTRTSAKLLTLYIDGVSVASATDTMTTSLTPQLTWAGVGVEHQQTWTYGGLMDDVRIYNRALATTDIAALAAM
jgi:hypothetical protein